MAAAAPLSARRRAARLRTGQAVFGAFSSSLRLLRWLLGGLVALYLGSGITRVGPQEDALVYRLGRLQRQVHPPGLLFALPVPFDRVVRVPTRTQQERFLIDWSPGEDSMLLSDATKAAASPAAPAGLPTVTLVTTPVAAVMPDSIAAALGVARPADKGLHPVFDGYTLTGDVNLVQARLTARYRIVDALAYVSAAQGDAVMPLFEAAIYDAATRALAVTRIDDAIGAGLENFRDRARTLAQERLDALGLGLSLVALEVNALTPPHAAVGAFADVTSAQVEARTSVEQTRTYQAQILPRARGEAFRARRQAEADAGQLVSRATAEAASFTALAGRHRAAPALVESRLHAEALEAVFAQAKTSTVLPDANGSIDLWFPSAK